MISLISINARGNLSSARTSVDLFSQIFKILVAYGLAFVVFMLGKKDDIEEEYLAEYFMFLGFSTLGLMMLVSSVELISIVIALEVSSYSLYVIVAAEKGPEGGPVRGLNEISLLRGDFHRRYALRYELPLRYGPFDVSTGYHGGSS